MPLKPGKGYSGVSGIGKEEESVDPWLALETPP